MNIVEKKSNDQRTLTQLKERLGRNQVKVAAMVGISPMQVSRILRGTSRTNPATLNNVIVACLDVIRDNGGYVEDVEIPPLKQKQLDSLEQLKNELKEYIDLTSKTTAKETVRESAEAWGLFPELVTRREAIARYFKNKETRYENWIMKHGKDIETSKGKGRNSTIYHNRKSLEASFRKHKIDF